MAIFHKKEILKNYMEFNRELNKDEYYIEEIDDNLFLLNDNLILKEFYNFYISNRDIEIINREYGELDKIIISSSDKLKYLLFIINNIDSEIEKNILKKSILELEKMINNKKINNKINKIHLLSHPIIKCNINDYLKFIIEYEIRKIFN
jgi:hypothetical protein